ncbi:MAG TPA: DMT family transporter [Candidatus Limnocylindrales bacterium]|nr:DMT family transporter [Candidatus Limnocylindrales bacterium]
MPESLISPSLMVVALGMLASLGWGAADFGGGLSSRSAPVLGVLGGSQVASMLVGVPILLASHEPAMGTTDLAVAIGGGILGAVGLSLLYRGLSIGRMGVVAPVAAVLTAALPVIYGFIKDGIPSGFALAGIALAVASVVLVSRAPKADGDDRPSGLGYALAAGTMFGLFTISASFFGDGLIVTPVIVIRITSILAIGGFLVLRRGAWRVPRRMWPALFAVGVIDMAATAAYLGAVSIGPLAIAAILASLYPVVTTVLATVVLRERVSAGHAVGILAAGAAVVLIAGAGAG